MTRKQFEDVREKLRTLIQNVAEDARGLENAAQDHFDDKSEKWQESDKGQEFDSLITTLSEVVASLEEADDTLAGAEWPL